MSHNHAADIEADILELSAKSEHVFVVCDTEVSADLVLLDVFCTDDYDDFRFILQLLEHIELAVRLEARQNSAGVIIIKQFTSEFEVKLVSELSYALLDLFGLYPKIFFVIKSRFHTECKVNFSYPLLQYLFAISRPLTFIILPLYRSQISYSVTIAGRYAFLEIVVSYMQKKGLADRQPFRLQVEP